MYISCYISPFTSPNPSLSISRKPFRVSNLRIPQICTNLSPARPSNQTLTTLSVVCTCSSSNNFVQPFGSKEAAHPEQEKPSSQTPEPGQVALVLLTRDPDVHTPKTCDNIHWKDDRAQDGELSEDIGGLLLSLVHADVDLG